MRRRGFSLAELLVSFLILSTLAVVMVGVMPTTIYGLHQAGERATAASLARQTLEQLRSQGLGSIRNVTFPAQTFNQLDYIVQVEYATANDSAGAPLDPGMALDVTVTVRWSGRGGPKSYTTRSLVARPR